MNVYGPNELRDDVLDKGMCIGCGACMSLCPYLRSYDGKTAMLFPCVRTKGRCYAYCPKAEADLDEVSRRLFGSPYEFGPLGHFLEVAAAKAGKKRGEGNYQAGGATSGLITYALEKKIIDAGVVTGRDGLLPRPRVVTDPAEVLKCASSKYTASPTLEAFNRAVRNGYRRIGVVATPCQVLALALMRTNPMEEADFVDPTGLVVGLFCTWALDYRGLRSLLAGRMDPDAIKKFDIPPPPAEIMEFHTGTELVTIPLGEIRLLVPKACEYCLDMTAEFADISVGVIEGRSDMNTVIIRTERGRDIFRNAVNDGYLEVMELPEINLEHLRTASGNKKKRALKKAKDKGMLNCNYNGGRAFIRVDAKEIEKI